MAMTKAEKAEMEALRINGALGWPRFEKPSTVPVEVMRAEANTSANRLFVGWSMNSYSGRVQQGCSSGTFHSADRTDKTTSQHPGIFYRTKLEALQAMRWEFCERMARELAGIDNRIAAALSPTTPLTVENTDG